LYMSLVKAKDMSVISTPPQDRLPVKNIIAENEDPLIQNAILRELAREGQVFFIHNRVESIYNRAAHIQKLVPSAKIAIVHGQMDSEEVDTIFHAFKSGEKDILFSTTIVENGVDVPNANTIIIDRADTFGLADLYQLRGRVGRWNRTAYAYFLTPKQRSLPEIARKRLAALLEAGGYGGGMKIAMRDLEIRGAGDILGIEQSGQVSAIGFHLYCKLLKRTIDALKKKIPASFIETKVEFPYDARLPESYVPESSLRMEIYHRLGESTTFKEIDEILAELKDRFGKPPEEVIWLYHFSRIRCFGSASQFTLLKIERNNLIAEQKMGDKEIKEIIPLPKGLTDPLKVEAAIFSLLKEKFHCRNI
ncbi:MAG TPA: helicase-related protein, partial [Chlamydiales bacterium]|nr:helicase-related protein [Chlamydiales bacterium]